MSKLIPLFSKMFGKISDTVWRGLRLDASTHSIQTIDYEHHEIHSGSHYELTDVVNLSINNVRDIRFTTPDTTKWSHILFEFDVESETEWHLYEDVVINTAGTAITPLNNNRNSTSASGTTLSYIDNTSVANANADTTVATATELEGGIIGSGKNSLGSTIRSNELVLKQNEDYDFRLIANAAGYVNYKVTWYEHQDKN